jgi:hypothetical protein
MRNWNIMAFRTLQQPFTIDLFMRRITHTIDDSVRLMSSESDRVPAETQQCSIDYTVVSHFNCACATLVVYISGVPSKVRTPHGLTDCGLHGFIKIAYIICDTLWFQDYIYLLGRYTCIWHVQVIEHYTTIKYVVYYTFKRYGLYQYYQRKIFRDQMEHLLVAWLYHGLHIHGLLYLM